MRQNQTMILKVHQKWSRKITLESFRNFAYATSFLRLKGFTWKRDYLISQKIQMPKTLSRPF